MQGVITIYTNPTINEENETWSYQSSENETLDYNKNSVVQNLSTNVSFVEDWGPKRDPLSIVIPITIVYILTLFSGVIGNVSTCIVIARNKSMHTATNYYLFSLAISDLLLLVCGLPPEIYYIWSKYPYIFGEAFCVLQGFAAETSANATVLTITAFTIERYVAICHPFLSHTLSKLSRAIKFIVLIWIVAMCLAIPQAMAFGVVYQRLSDGRIIEDHCVCMIKRLLIPHAFEISTVVFFVAPMSLITVLYVLIGLQLHRSTVRPSRGNSVKLKHRVCKSGPNYASPPTQQAVVVLNGDASEKLHNVTQEEDGRKNFAKNAQATKHVVKMLIAVVVAFFICWAPFHAQRLFAIYGKQNSKGIITAFQVLTYVSGVFYYLSTTVNPLLYHIMSHKFREAFKGTYKQCFRRGHRTPGGRCYSTLSGRSSQVNSHSNTDSYSRQSSLRYLDAEMARLHDSRRPLVVSFRRKKPATLRARPKQVTIFDSELQEALSSLKNTEPVNNTYMNENSSSHHDLEGIPVLNNMKNDCSFVEVYNLQPTHVCPLTVTEFPTPKIYSTLEDIEIFQEQQFKFNLNRICNNSKSRSSSLKYESMAYNNDFITKSCTMPEIKNRLSLSPADAIDETNRNFDYWKENIQNKLDNGDLNSSQMYLDGISLSVN